MDAARPESPRADVAGPEVGTPHPVLLLPGEGLGGLPGTLQLGATRTDLVQALGEPGGQRRRADGTGQELLYADRGLQVTLDPAGRIETFTVGTTGLDPFFRADSEAQLEDGIKITAGLEAIVARWGPPTTVSPGKSPFYEAPEVWQYPTRGAALLVSAPVEGKQLMGLRIRTRSRVTP